MSDIPRRGSFQVPSPFGPAITVEKAIKTYGRLKALDSVDIEVRRGEIFGLIGPNGAGKSTLMRSLVGSLQLDSGTVRVLGLNPLSERLRIKAYAGYVPESEVPPSFLTVGEFLEFVLHARGMERDDDAILKWTSFFDLEGYKDTIARNLSKGTRQKLMLASAFVHEPPILLLDEPFINLDPIYQRKVKDHLVDYSGKGGTVMICTHILPLAEELCTRVCIINKGRVLRTSTVEEMTRDYGGLEEAFLNMVGFYSR